MLKLFRSLITVLWVSGMLSCSGRDSMREVEALLDTDPVAADSMLTSMPVSKYKRNQAWYAVLKTQAEYKCGKSFVSDNLIRTATEY